MSAPALQKSTASGQLRQRLERNHHGEAVGVFSVCSANPFVLQAAIHQAAAREQLLVVESTSNQVNQYGGYTGMQAPDFVARMEQLAEAQGLPASQVCIGADHAGPNPWQQEESGTAMEKAIVSIRDSVAAGYQKIHLDASMRCADDDPAQALPPALSAERAARLCEAAEKACPEGGSPPLYVIGSEVPVPGGAQGDEAELRVTRREDVQQMLALHKAAFLRRGLEAAWERVIAVVVQPGVEFGDQGVHAFDPAQAEALSRFIEGERRLVYEAHSTDYQSRRALRQLVTGHFAILKVGPALTFALREALSGLASIENELLPLHTDMQASGLMQTLESQMVAEPAYWARYYPGTEAAQAFARKYSLSDRARYYWDKPQVQDATIQLLHNLESNPPPASLLSQYFPVQYAKVREERLAADPRALILDKISEVLDDYAEACEYSQEG